jgi:1-deoxy-D-xylulose-5-phosphate reductoisomerase
MNLRKISLLGSTGSIGVQTLDVVQRHSDKIQVCALASGKNNLEKLAKQVQTFQPAFVAVPDEESRNFLKEACPDFRGEIGIGLKALEEAAALSEATHVVVAVVGSLGLVPSLRALQAGKVVALANKETLVAGGHLVVEALKKGNGSLVPIDSEHSAIFQCLRGEKKSEVEKIWLTASGGPFRGFTQEQLKHVTKSQVLNHPVWKMGSKITVDSATLMNKGLEVIEAKWLFDISPKRIRVVVHPQGIIHSMVEFVDGSVMAQLGLPDMRTPIQLALSLPDRWESPPPKLDFTRVGSLTFEEPDMETFPCLRYAFEAAEKGGSLPAVLNAANEAAVQLFLEEKIHFLEIPLLIERAMASHLNKLSPSLEDVLEADSFARKFVLENFSKKIGVR